MGGICSKPSSRHRSLGDETLQASAADGARVGATQLMQVPADVPVGDQPPKASPAPLPVKEGGGYKAGLDSMEASTPVAAEPSGEPHPGPEAAIAAVGGSRGAGQAAPAPACAAMTGTTGSSVPGVGQQPAVPQQHLPAGAGQGRSVWSQEVAAPGPAQHEAERERLAEVHSSKAVVAGGHPGLDSITQLCAKLYNAQVSAINLIDESRLEFASVAGPLAHSWGTGADRAGSFCEKLLLPQAHTLLCIPDTAKDVRFNCLSCVAEDPHVRFYAGTPLVSSRGHRLGSLCIFDLRPRTLSPDALNLLACLAEMASRLLEQHKVGELEKEQRRRKAAAAAALEREPAVVKAAVLLCDTSAPDQGWPIMWANEAAAALTGLLADQLRGKGFFEVFLPPAGPSTPPELQAAAEEGQAFNATLALPGSSTGKWAEVQFSPATQQLLEGASSHPVIDLSAALQATGAHLGQDVGPSLMFASIQPPAPAAPAAAAAH